MRFRDIERLPSDNAIDSFGEAPAEQPRRPWLLVVASLMLVALVAVVWGKWAESRNEADQLRAEVKQVYREAETLRTQAVQAEQRAELAEQRVAALEQQARSLRAERGDLLQRMEAAGVEKPAPKTRAPKRPARRAPAP